MTPAITRCDDKTGHPIDCQKVVGAIALVKVRFEISHHKGFPHVIKGILYSSTQTSCSIYMKDNESLEYLFVRSVLSLGLLLKLLYKIDLLYHLPGLERF